MAFSLLQLPPELVLLIYDHLLEPELLKFCQVSSLAKQLALPVLFARYSITGPQIQSRELLNVPSRALRSLSAAYPNILSNIQVLDLRFSREIQQLPVLRFLMQFAQRFPVIPRITFTFEHPMDTSHWAHFLAALTVLLSDGSKPVGIIDWLLSMFVVTPGQSGWGNILRRATTYTVSQVGPTLDSRKLTKSLQTSLRSTPRSPESIYLHLPRLSLLSIWVDLEFRLLTRFIDRHDRIEFLQFAVDCSGLHTRAVPPFSTSALKCLEHLHAGARDIACLLETYDLPLLRYVKIGALDSPRSNNPNNLVHLQAAFDAVASQSSVTVLEVDLRDIPYPPWNE
ncbi:hypothetical protein DFH07DRAFT_783331 [Mycena maculata]|uniref:F-box domain-containing protein n=1 Tax=Mycena maculata TaxID=230809 RepID=A0AAD7HNA3_9AGAR|nr:hypothetical protein DFH07DRAFT_783331 [Mycena maculata]